MRYENNARLKLIYTDEYTGETRVSELGSRLSILMDNFVISGKDLSGLLHIDSSLVSKWRCGKRALKPNSIYTNQIIKHVMALDSNNQYAKIRLILSLEYMNVFKCTENEIALFLKDYLTSVSAVTENKRDHFDEIKNLTSASLLSTYTLPGANGRRQAIQFFLRYAQYLSPGIEMWCYTTENSKWLYESQEFFNEWFMRHMSILNEENKIKIIHSMSSSYESLAISMFTWMPMHMSGRTTAYINPKYKQEQLVFTYFLIKDHLALYNWSMKQPICDISTYITHELLLVKDIEVLLRSHINESIRIFEHFGYDSKDDYINNLVADMEKEMHTYHWSISFDLRVSDELMRVILIENGFSGEALDQQLENFKFVAALGNQSTHCFLIDLQRLSALLSSSDIVLNVFSFTCGRTFKIQRSTFVRLVVEALQVIIDSDTLHICLASTDLLKRLSDTEVIAIENTAIHFTRTQGDKPLALVTKELTVITAIYSYFEALWDTAPTLYKNKEYVSRQIMKLIEEADTNFRLG